MKRFLSFIKAAQILGFLFILLGLAFLLNLLTLSSLTRLNTGLSDMQDSIRWRLSLAQVEDAWQQQSLLFRRGLLLPQNPPSQDDLTNANKNWERQISDLRALTTDPDSLEYLLTLPPVARAAFVKAVLEDDFSRRASGLDQAFSTNQAIDFWLEDQALQANAFLQAHNQSLRSLVAEYNLIGLGGISLLALVGIWILFWASRLLQPLLALRMALAAAASGSYQPAGLDRVKSHSGPFGDLARAIDHVIQHIQNEEETLQIQVDELTRKLAELRQARFIQRAKFGEEVGDE
jgi:CHASE3 domain sensor protein